MVKKSNFSSLFIVVLFLLVLSIVFVIPLSVTGGIDVDDYCVENVDGELLCMNFFSGQSFTIIPDKSVVSPYEKVTLGLSFSLSSFDDIFSARFQIFDSNNRLVRSWDYTNDLKNAVCNSFTGSCSSFGESINLNSVSSFNAPGVDGDYFIAHKIVGFENGVYKTLIQERTSFSVVVDDVSCPPNTINEWFVFDSFTGGDWLSRDIVEFGSSPGCVQSSFTEFKTICDEGYHVRGSSSRFSDGTKSCVLDSVDVTCYRCDGVMVQSFVFDDVCGSGWSLDVPVCDGDVVLPEPGFIGFNIINGCDCAGVSSGVAQFSSAESCVGAVADLAVCSGTVVSGDDNFFVDNAVVIGIIAGILILVIIGFSIFRKKR